MWLSKEFHDVYVFNKKFDLLIGDGPGHLSIEKMRERVSFMQEELDELRRAALNNDLPEQADALVDIVYVALGTVIMLGLPWLDLWDEVQRANMTKVRGTTKRGNKVDVTKPEGWRAPEHAAILDEHGYNRTEWIDLRGNLLAGRDDTERGRVGASDGSC